MAPVRYRDPQTSVLYRGDNLEQLVDFPSDCVDLIYLDPPFFSNKNYEVIWGDEAEVRSFEDRWEGGIQVYVDWLRDRMLHLHRVLKPTGTLYLHCDWHAGHYLKQMVDEVFGYHRFLNELIWCYETGGRATSSFPRKHDTILRYGKTKETKFNYDAIALPRDFSTMHEPVHIDEDGREYQRNIKGGKEYRYYRDQGVLPNDWWVDIQALNPAAKERLGYPTQKPETLLERIILASSDPGDLVLDPFCGCGTTVAVAERLKRKWIGIDISPTAVRLMKRRVEKAGAENVRAEGLPMDEDELRSLKHFEFQNWVIDQVNGTHSPHKSGDKGVDGWSFMYNEPIQVKQSDKVNRKVVDEFQAAIDRNKKDRGYVVAFSFTRGAYEEAARVKSSRGLTIALITVEELLKAEDAITRPEVMGRRRAPDLMRLLTVLEKEVSERPLPKGRSKKARPSSQELVESDLLPVPA